MSSQSSNGRVKKSASEPNSTKLILLARFVADLLDQRFTIPGTSIRIGLDPIISLIPGIGDALANIAGSAILLIGVRMGVPKVVLLRMGINIAVNTVLGLVPVVGDVVSIGFRSNVYNLRLLEKHTRLERVSTVQDWIFVSGLFSALLLIFAGGVAAMIFLLRKLAAL